MRPLAAIRLLLPLCALAGAAHADTPANAVSTRVVTPGQSYPGVDANSEGWFDVGGFCKIVDVGDLSSLNPTAKGVPVFVPGPAAQWENYRAAAPAHYNGQLTLTTCCRPQTDIAALCTEAGASPVSVTRQYGRLGEIDTVTATCTDQWGKPYTDSVDVSCVTADGGPDGPDEQGMWAPTGTDSPGNCTPDAYVGACSATCGDGTQATYDSCGNPGTPIACNPGSCCTPAADSCSGACGGGAGVDNCGNACTNNDTCSTPCPAAPISWSSEDDAWVYWTQTDQGAPPGKYYTKFGCQTVFPSTPVGQTATASVQMIQYGNGWTGGFPYVLVNDQGDGYYANGQYNGPFPSMVAYNVPNVTGYGLAPYNNGTMTFACIEGMSTGANPHKLGKGVWARVGSTTPLPETDLTYSAYGYDQSLTAFSDDQLESLATCAPVCSTETIPPPSANYSGPLPRNGNSVPQTGEVLWSDLGYNGNGGPSSDNGYTCGARIPYLPEGQTITVSATDGGGPGGTKSSGSATFTCLHGYFTQLDGSGNPTIITPGQELSGGYSDRNDPNRYVPSPSFIAGPADDSASSASSIFIGPVANYGTGSCAACVATPNSCDALCGGGSGYDSCGNSCQNNSTCAACNPATVANGNVNPQTCAVTCDDNYILGQDASGNPTCTYQDPCGTVAHGSTNGWPTCTITCDPGYINEGSTSSFNGGFCGPGTNTCSPASVTNGSVNANTCAITCNSGYTLSGSSCVSSTNTCSPTTVANGSVNGSTCAITCNSGYTLSGTSCVAAAPACTPATVANGNVNSSTCAITCNSGYTLSGSTCVPSGCSAPTNWSNCSVTGTVQCGVQGTQIGYDGCGNLVSQACAMPAAATCPAAGTSLWPSVPGACSCSVTDSLTSVDQHMCSAGPQESGSQLAADWAASNTSIPALASTVTYYDPADSVDTCSTYYIFCSAIFNTGQSDDHCSCATAIYPSGTCTGENDFQIDPVFASNPGFASAIQSCVGCSYSSAETELTNTAPASYTPPTPPF